MAKHAGNGSEIAVIGIGDFGSELLTKLMVSGQNRPLLFRIDWDDCLPELSDEYIHIALNSRHRGFTNGDPIAAAKATAEAISELVDVTLSVSFVLMIAQPGDGIGSGVTTALANIFRGIEIPFLTLLALPDAEHVGRKRHMTARTTISELCHMKETPVVFDQAEFPGYLKAFKIAVSEKVQMLLDALSPGMIPIDFNRIRNALCGSSGSTIVTARATGTKRAQEVVESVLADYAIEPFLQQKASVLMHLQSDVPISLYEVEEVAQSLTKHWGADVDLIYGISQGRCDNEELRLGLIIGEYCDSETEYEHDQNTDQSNGLVDAVFSRLHSELSL